MGVWVETLGRTVEERGDGTDQAVRIDHHHISSGGKRLPLAGDDLPLQPGTIVVGLRGLPSPERRSADVVDELSHSPAMNPTPHSP
jgi:hypothetical protein